MKFFHVGLVTLAAASVAMASAQVINRPAVVRHTVRQSQGAVNRQGLVAVQQDLLNAIQAMESALPIYDGDRIKSIKLSHHALMLIDQALSGAKAALRPHSTAKDTVGSKSAHGRYTAAQISASQAAMNQGLQYLLQAESDLQAAVYNNPGKKGVEVFNLIQQAVVEAKTAISLHAGA